MYTLFVHYPFQCLHGCTCGASAHTETHTPRDTYTPAELPAGSSRFALAEAACDAINAFNTHPIEAAAAAAAKINDISTVSGISPRRLFCFPARLYSYPHERSGSPTLPHPSLSPHTTHRLACGVATKRRHRPHNALCLVQIGLKTSNSQK